MECTAGSHIIAVLRHPCREPERRIIGHVALLQRTTSQSSHRTAICSKSQLPLRELRAPANVAQRCSLCVLDSTPPDVDLVQDAYIRAREAEKAAQRQHAAPSAASTAEVAAGAQARGASGAGDVRT
jgi:hypothetical protein